MKSPRAATVRLLARAAELRAGGASWEQVAAALRRTPDTCRSWPQRYPALWRRSYRAAAASQLAEAGAEAVHVLRRLLRSDDEKMRRDVGRELVRLIDRRRPRPTARPRRAPADPLTAYLGSLADDQLQALTAESRALAGRLDPPPGDDHPAVSD